MNCQFEVSTYSDFNHSWMVDLSLNEFLKIIFDLIGMLSTTNKYTELLELLKKSYFLIEKILKNYIIESNNTSYSEGDNFRSEAGKK